MGIQLGAAADASSAVMAYVSRFVSPAAAASLLGGMPSASTPFQPLCPPVCLNLGSFAQLLASASCVCGSATLDVLRAAAGDGTRVAAIALAGAGAMWVAATLLLACMASHVVSDRHDGAAARQLQQRAADEYESGFLADPADCVLATQLSGQGSAPLPQRLMMPGSGAAAAAAAAPFAHVAQQRVRSGGASVPLF